VGVIIFGILYTIITGNCVGEINNRLTIWGVRDVRNSCQNSAVFLPTKDTPKMSAYEILNDCLFRSVIAVKSDGQKPSNYFWRQVITFLSKVVANRS